MYENIDEAATQQAAARDARNLRLRRRLIVGGVVAALAGTLWYYLTGGRYVSTDDAFVQAARSTVSASVSGRVLEILVHDNQRVKKDQPLFRLDDYTYRLVAEDARARLETAKLEIGAARAAYQQQLSSLAAARTTLAYQQTEFERQQRLLASGISSRSRFEQASHDLELAKAGVHAAQQQVLSALAALGGNADLPIDQQPRVVQARAALDRANLDLAHCVVHAWDDGVVAKVEQLQVGDFVTIATPLFSLISTRDVWIEANFKEDDLTYMRPGQAAEVKVDTYGDRTLHAHVTSLSPGTGAQFSVLPPENATGNWVKVVQRVPVRLELDAGETAADRPLQAGLSAVVTVDTGHRRALFGGDAGPAAAH